MPPRRSRSKKSRFRRRRYGKGKRYRKSYRHRGRAVKQVRKVKGLRSKLNNKPEMKFTHYESNLVPVNLPGATTTAIWANQGRDAGGGTNYFITPPTPANGTESGYVGAQYNSLYADVRFIVESQTMNDAIASGNLSYHDQFRLMVVRMRQPYTIWNQDPGFLEATMPALTCTPIDTKQWDVWLDKQYTFANGLTDTIVPGMGLTTGVTTLRSGPITFKFKVPLKQTIRPVIQGGIATLTYKYLVLICILPAVSGLIRVTELHCKFYYRDP